MKKKYLEALRKVPVCNEETIRSIMEYLCSQAEMLGEMGYQEMETRKAAAELKQTCEDLENTKEVLTATLEELRISMMNFKKRNDCPPA